jgi:hypothetical protein
MTNKEYYIKSNHSVFIDDYEQGEGKQVNEYNLKAIIKAQNVKEALIKYFDKKLYFSFDIKFIHDNDEGGFYYSNLVDEENSEATESEVNQWKEGKKTLYSNNTYLSIYELNKINVI